MSEWISIDTKLPNKNDKVIIYTPKCMFKIQFGIYDERFEEILSPLLYHEYYFPSNIKYWIPFPKHDDWIKIKDELPKGNVILYSPLSHIKIRYGHWSKENQRFEYFGLPITGVQYWIPIPKKPNVLKIIIKKYLT